MHAAAAEREEVNPAMPANRTKPIQLRFDGKGEVVVTPQDQDRFVMTVQVAVNACRAHNDQVVWREQFLHFAAAIHDWCKSRASKLRAAYLSVRGSGLAVFILTKEPTFDFEFNREVSALDLELMRKFPRCPAELLQMPAVDEQELSGFLDVAGALQIYGDGNSASRKGRAEPRVR